MLKIEIADLKDAVDVSSELPVKFKIIAKGCKNQTPSLLGMPQVVCRIL